jgi:hypothetical protein
MPDSCRGDPVEHQGVVPRPGHLRREGQNGALPNVSMGVDEARNDEAPLGVDHLGIRGRGRKAVADGGNLAVLNDTVAALEVADGVVDGHDVSTLDKQFARHELTPPFPEIERNRDDGAASRFKQSAGGTVRYGLTERYYKS